MANTNINSFVKLEEFLRNWTSFKDHQVYDLIGMATLFAACLDNLKQNMNDADFEEIDDCFTECQKQFLKKLSE